MKKRSLTQEEFPLKLVGSSIFGRYPKICSERTYNMIISDNFMVPYPGYIKQKTEADFGFDPGSNAKGRAIYRSNQLGDLFVVLQDRVFLISTSWGITELTTSIVRLSSLVGTVYIAENTAGKIVFCDGVGAKIWVYDYAIYTGHLAPTFEAVVTPFVPAHISYQDGYFIAATRDKAEWRLALNTELTTWPNTGLFQTIPDVVRACIPLPGRGGQLFVMGGCGTESWVDVGASLFPYQKNTGYSIDYGCLSTSTIARSENIIAWLGGNNSSGAVIMYTTGGEAIPISTDGINFQLSNLKHPEESTGFLFKKDGHLLYQLSFTNSEDNYSLVYDFTTQKFFNLTDHEGNYHIAKNVALFNNVYCFISIDDASLYVMGSEYTTYDYKEIPMVRVCNNLRFADSSGFVVNSITFPIEQGENKDISRIDMSISRDGGVSYGNDYGIVLNDYAHRKNRLVFWNLGYANDFVPRFKFWGHNRFVFADGVISIYK